MEVFMKFATVLMSLILAGVFANAQGTATAPATSAQEGAKMEAPVKKEKKHKKHSKKEKAEKSEKAEEGTKQ